MEVAKMKTIQFGKKRGAIFEKNKWDLKAPTTIKENGIKKLWTIEKEKKWIKNKQKH